MALADMCAQSAEANPNAPQEEAAHWYRVAIDRCGSNAARYCLGLLRGVQGRLDGDPDGDDAETWLLQAAEAQFGYAYEDLGQVREAQGRLRGEMPGGSAESWYLRAVEAGFESARAGLDRVRSS